MEDWFAQPERSITRVAFNGTTDATDQFDPFRFHQGVPGLPNGTRPGWDPFDFNQHDRDTPVPTPWIRAPQPDVPTPPKPDVPVPLPPLPDSVNPHEIKLPDGAVNITDDQGRVILTRSADGSKTREVRYGDASDPNKVTEVIIDKNRVYTRGEDGRSWGYTVDGQQSGTWRGDIHMSRKGDYSFEDDTTGEQRKFSPNTAEIVDPSKPPRPNPSPITPEEGGGCNSYRQPYRPGVQYGGYYNQGQGSCYDGGGGCSPYYGGNRGYGGYQRSSCPSYYGGGGGSMAGAYIGQVIGRSMYGHRRR